MKGGRKDKWDTKCFNMFHFPLIKENHENLKENIDFQNLNEEQFDNQLNVC